MLTLWYHLPFHLVPAVHLVYLSIIMCLMASNTISESEVTGRVQLFTTPCQWDSLGKNTEVGCHFLLQRIFPTQGSNPGLPHCRQMLYHLSHQGKRVLLLAGSFGAFHMDFFTRLLSVLPARWLASPVMCDSKDQG